MAVTWITGADTADPLSPDADAVAEAASWILYKLTAEKYPGIRSAVEWYGFQGATCSSCFSSFDSSIEGAIAEHFHTYLPRGGAYSQNVLRLRHTPIVSVQSVSAGGEEIPSASYKVSNRAYLVRNGDCWNLNEGITVDYTFGIKPPAAGVMAARKLANELLLAVTESGECALPARVQAISRQGMDYTILDPQDFINEGRTGIYEIDIFIAAANPTRAKKRPRVFSPHIPRGNRYT